MCTYSNSLQNQPTFIVFVVVIWKPPMLGEGGIHAMQGAECRTDLPKAFFTFMKLHQHKAFALSPLEYHEDAAGNPGLSCIPEVLVSFKVARIRK